MPIHEQNASLDCTPGRSPVPTPSLVFACGIAACGDRHGGRQRKRYRMLDEMAHAIDIEKFVSKARTRMIRLQAEVLRAPRLLRISTTAPNT